jgi:hypothetical protein
MSVNAANVSDALRCRAITQRSQVFTRWQERPCYSAISKYSLRVLQSTPGHDPARDTAIVATYAEAGVSWWLEHINP